MAVTIVATVGAADANSYVTLIEAEAYMESRRNASLWDAATTDSKNRALVEATRDLSTRTYDGDRVTTTQALAWPRQWAPDPDSPTGDYFLSTVVPQRVKDATCELAFQFVKAGTTDVAALDPNDGVIEKTVDVLKTRWAEPHTRAKGLARYPRVYELIRPLLLAPGATVRLLRG